jgi:hypothetical protein
LTLLADPHDALAAVRTFVSIPALFAQTAVRFDALSRPVTTLEALPLPGTASELGVQSAANPEVGRARSTPPAQTTKAARRALANRRAAPIESIIP